MGNRAVITASKAQNVAGSNDIGVYLHYNGGRDSVEAFLKYCKLQGFRSPETDCYGYARLCQVIANYFGGGLSVGVEKCVCLDCDNWDNGVYVIENWEIVGRQFMNYGEQHHYEMLDMLLAIDEAQPEKMQLGAEKIKEALDAESVADGPRFCEVCGAEMRSGFCVNGGDSYYCSEKCLHDHFTQEEYEEMYKDGDAYWTNWEE